MQSHYDASVTSPASPTPEDAVTPPARDWLIAPIAPVLDQGGGIDGVIERANAFIQQTIGVS